eukprot:10237431-Alexandrium_andersonii.AAC.1
MRGECTWAIPSARSAGAAKKANGQPCRRSGTHAGGRSQADRRMDMDREGGCGSTTKSRTGRQTGQRFSSS